MLIACQTGMLPTGTILEKFKRMKSWGIEGVEACPPFEVIDSPNPELALNWERETRDAMDATGLPVTSFCGGMRWQLLQADPELRKADVKRAQRLLHIAGRLGANGCIMVPRFNGPNGLPDLSPLKTSVELETELLIAQMKALAPVAAEANTRILLEPLNRYEAPWFHRLEQATAICNAINDPSVCCMGDLFHMSLEEMDPPKAILENGKWLRHVHLADSTRKQPGTARTDFAASFAALKKIGFKWAMALECGIAGEIDAAMTECVAFLKRCRG